MNSPPTLEERIWAVLSHLSALAFGMGILLPILGWSEGRRKSRYISFHCLQALGYQSLGYTVWLLAYIVLVLLFLVVLFIAIGLAERNGEMSDPLSTLWAGAFVLVMLGSLAVYLLFPVLAAIACALGRDYRYPLLGSRLAHYLGYEPAFENGELNKKHEERWVAAMGHFSVIIVLWGMLAPLTVWILQGRHSLFLKFQSLQTTLYQAFVNLLYLAAAMIYTLGILIVFALIGLEADPNVDSAGDMAGILLLFGILLLAALIMLSLPLFHILGQIAGYRVLKGDDYRYPLIGRLVERWAAPKTPPTGGKKEPLQ